MIHNFKWTVQESSNNWRCCSIPVLVAARLASVMVCRSWWRCVAVLVRVEAGCLSGSRWTDIHLRRTCGSVA